MKDSIDRVIDYLRISITDRCNLRCVYCVDENTFEEMSHSDILTYEEIIRLVQIFVSIGIKNIKITGGEPLVRNGVVELIKSIKSIEGVETLTLTTNGVLLSNYIEELNNAKIDAINISLDSIDKNNYKNITRRDELDKVLLGIKEATKYKNIKIKINTVLLNNYTHSKKNIIDIAHLSKDYNIDVRFIELMPISLGKNYKSENEAEILNILKEEYGEYKEYNKKLGNGPAHYYLFENFLGAIGFISAISHSFCNTCNKVRLTSFGLLKTCLGFDDGINLKNLIRIDKADDNTIKEMIIKAIKEKPVRHNFYTTNNIANENTNSMNEIGG